MNNGDDETEAMERRLRMKWEVGRKSPSPLDDAETKRMAERLLGRDNALRLAKRKSSNRPFRPAPVIVKYEYWYVKPSADRLGFWRIDRIENGRSSEHKTFNGREGLDTELAALRHQNYQCTEVTFGLPPTTTSAPTPSRAKSRRAEMIERFGAFKAGSAK